MHLSGYSSPFNFGHKALEDFWAGEIVVQEKIDGSQFSFGINADGELGGRSRNQDVIMSADDNSMFAKAIKTVLALKGIITPGLIYRGEYLAKPKHNTLPYGRVPKDHIILFDIDRGDQDYLSPGEMTAEADRIGLEAVPLLAILKEKPKIDDLKKLLETKSVLGDVPIEGIVLKNYALFGRDKKVLMAKYVSEKFKETHSKDWKQRNPGHVALIEELADAFGGEARWAKAVQHLREDGAIEGVVQDIPTIMREINQDILKDAKEEIGEQLFRHFWKQISRLTTRGFPEWYKNRLLEDSLGGDVIER